MGSALTPSGARCEHAHWLVNEPGQGEISRVLQALKVHAGAQALGGKQDAGRLPPAASVLRHFYREWVSRSGPAVAFSLGKTPIEVGASFDARTEDVSTAVRWRPFRRLPPRCKWHRCRASEPAPPCHPANEPRCDRFGRPLPDRSAILDRKRIQSCRR